jgi:fatty acid desaturase
MIWLCTGILVMRVVDLFWIAVPAGDDPETKLPLLTALLTLAAIVGIGGPWIAMFLWLLDSAPLMPVGDFVPPGKLVLSVNGMQEKLGNRHGRQQGTEPSALA